MARGGARKGSGQKKIKLDYETCEKLASIMCTQAEIADFLGVSTSKLEHDEKFKEIHRKGINKGRASIRRMQYKACEDGNPTMLIWLGKQYLKQRDMKDIQVTNMEIVVDIEEDNED